MDDNISSSMIHGLFETRKKKTLGYVGREYGIRQGRVREGSERCNLAAEQTDPND